MSTPPRRRRPARSEKPEGGGWLPTLAMGVGVVVAGLAIGALVAVLMQRSGERPPVAQAPAVVVTSTPGSTLATRPPIAIETLEPTRTERPSPTPAPASPEPTATVTPDRPTPRPTATVRPRELVARASSPAPTRAVETVRPSATPEVAATTSVRVTPTAAPASPSASSAAASSASPSVYDEHASAVVRRYVDALIRGDQQTAYAALGGSGTLSEASFLDPSARIVSVKVTRIDASNASVGCEIATAKGSYYATFHVTAATSGPYISEHDYIKV